MGPKLGKLIFNLVTHELENLLNLTDEDNFLGWARDGPVFKKSHDEWNH